MVVFSASAYATPLFLTARDIGVGKSEIAGFWGTDHNAGGSNADGSTYTDRQGLNLRYLYGLADRVNVFLAYSLDSYPNFPFFGQDTATPGVDLATKVISGNSYSLGIKYAYLKATEGYPLDIAFLLGYQNTSATFNARSSALSYNKDWTEGHAGWSAGCICSRKIQALTPYFALGYGQRNTFEYKYPISGGTYPSISQSSILINLGIEYELLNDLSTALEYQYENTWGQQAQSSAWKVDPSQASFSGVYLALKYKI